MRKLFYYIDDLLNSITMYKGVLYGLVSLLTVAVLLGFTDVIGVDPLAIVVLALTLGAVCYVSSQLFAYIYKAPTNSESWLITALILTCIITPEVSAKVVIFAALAGVIAMASKYVLVRNGTHIFNPAAMGAFVVSTAGLLSVGWWIATPWLLPFTIGIGVIALRKQRKFTVFAAFALSAIAVMLLVNMGGEQTSVEVIKSIFLSWPLVFLGSIMLIEPLTLPARKYDQLLVAIVVGAVFSSQLHFWQLSSSPQTALLIGNALAALLAVSFGAMLRVRKVTKLAPDILEVTFDRPKNLHYTAGQYMEWTLAHAGTDIRGNRRTFSIASAPSEDDVRIAVRTFDKSSSYKRALAGLKEGAKIRVARVAGEFILPEGDQPLLWIAGGIGITPFRSMAAQMAALGLKRDIVMVYVASSAKHFVYTDLFDVAPKLGIQTYYKTGVVSDSELHDLVPDLADRQVYISGPNAMVRHYATVVRTLGASSQQIHKDFFSGY